MQHIMKLYENNFYSLIEGNKIREYRLYDEKRKVIKIGDEIKFVKLPHLEDYIIVNVEDIEVFNNWYDAYRKYFEEDFKEFYDSIETVVNDTYNGYYTKEESDKYGCVIFTFSRCRS